MLDKDRHIAAQAEMKEIIAKCPTFDTNEEEENWIYRRFTYVMTLIDDYATAANPLAEAQRKASGLHLSDEKVAQSLPPPGRFQDRPFPESALGQVAASLQKLSGTITAVSAKEYKPGKFLYGVKVGDRWFSSFWANHYETAKVAKAEETPVELIYTVEDYKGKPSYKIQSIE